MRVAGRAEELAEPAVVSEPNVTIGWTAPVSGPLSTYFVEVGSTGDAIDLGILDLGGPVVSATAAAAPGTYFVRVRGANACGMGAPSNEIKITVP